MGMNRPYSRGRSVIGYLGPPGVAITVSGIVVAGRERFLASIA
jgi:hypothetical protein